VIRIEEELLFLKKKKQKNFWSASRGADPPAAPPRAKRTKSFFGYFFFKKSNIFTFLSYALFSWLYLVRGAPLTSAFWGRGADAFAFAWALAWWPWAITHHMPLLHTELMWRPEGVYTFWMTSVPLLAALAAPVTLTLGPVAAYNLLVWGSPVLSAMMMFFVCLRMTKSFWPAWLGGYLFGFSSYQMAAAQTLNLAFTVFVPAAAWVVLARWQGGISRAASVGLLAAVMVGQFLVSTEIFAQMAVFGAAFFGLAALLAPGWRGRLAALAVDAAAAGALAGLVLAVPLVSMFAHLGVLQLPAIWRRFHVADVLGTVIPGVHTALGGGWSRAFIFRQFSDVREDYSYLGLPLVVILYGFARRRWADVGIRWLALAVALVTVASWGPALWAAGRYTGVPAPWAAVAGLPFLKDFLPARLALFAAFGTAALACLWLDEKPDFSRALLAVVACLAIMPGAPGRQAVPNTVFFAPGRVQAVLGPDPQLLVLPFAIRGASTYWQVENGFGFTMTGGYLGFPPAAAQHFPAVWELIGGRPEDFVPLDFFLFLRATGAQYVVAGPGTPGALMDRLERLGWPERHVDDVTVFSVPAGKPSS